jgi:hypothetical protein
LKATEAVIITQFWRGNSDISCPVSVLLAAPPIWMEVLSDISNTFKQKEDTMRDEAGIEVQNPHSKCIT